MTCVLTVEKYSCDVMLGTEREARTPRTQSSC